MTKRKKIIIITSIIVAVLLIDLTITGFLKFEYNVVRCGGMPVKVTMGGFAAGSSTYAPPGHYVPGGSSSLYFCTEQEAIDRGIIEFLYM